MTKIPRGLLFSLRFCQILRKGTGAGQERVLASKLGALRYCRATAHDCWTRYRHE